VISDLSRLTAAIDAVTEPVPDVDLAALEGQVKALTPEQRERVRAELLQHGRTTVSLNGHPIVLQIRHRMEPRP
jgi:hypothetical protein